MSGPPPVESAPDLRAGGDAEIRHCTHCLAIYRNEFTRCPVDGAPIATSSSDPLLGAAITEHYQIDEFLGAGSSGRVYLAHHSRLAQRRFALKVLFGDLAVTAAARMRFTHEAETASRLAHPNLLSVVDFGRTSTGLLYLAMDYIDGPTLARMIARDGAMPQERVVHLALQLCRGLAHAHDLGLVHRDFKPDNVLVSSDAHGDVPRIVDFGIALSSADDEGDARLTAVGMTLGTPAYAAPEQSGDGEVDQRADLFALGVTLYELLTGKLPFDGSLVEMMRKNATVDPPPMMERNPEVTVTAPLQQVVSKLMARDPAQRYQTAREVLEALTELMSLPTVIPRASSAAMTAPAPAGVASAAIVSAGLPAKLLEIPDCVAVGFVDMSSGALLAVRTVDSHPQAVLDLVGSATSDLFRGQNIAQIERLFRRSRGQPEDGRHYFNEILLMSENLLHVFLRSRKNSNHVAVFVTRASANIGMVLAKSRAAMRELEARS